MKQGARLKRNAEIDRMLADGVSVRRIALEVGLTERTVFSRKALRLREKTGDVVTLGPGAGTDYRDDLAREVAADLAVLEQWEKQLGLPPLPDVDLDLLLAAYPISPTLPD